MRACQVDHRERKRKEREERGREGEGEGGKRSEPPFSLASCDLHADIHNAIHRQVAL